jgi:hypothetical protein
MDFRKLAFWVLVCGMILRVATAAVNREANDDHLSVIKIMAFEGRIPDKYETPQAYHPKLYHGTAAALVRLLPRQWPQLHETVSQLLSSLAGILTVLLAYRFFMKDIELSDKVRLVSFSLLALNPVLIGINAQATNDSFVILFGSLAFYFGWRFFQNQRAVDFTCMSAFSILAFLSKVNGLVIFIAIVAVFGVALLRRGASDHLPRRVMAIYGFIYLVSYLLLAPILGPYWEHYRRYGTPLPNNVGVKADPLPFRLPPEAKAGEVSVLSALFTFPFVELVRNPVIPTDESGRHLQYPTSLWAELYARTHFVHFDAWPRSWQLPTRKWQWVPNAVLDVGRVIFILALLPTIMMLGGLLKSLYSAIRSFVVARLADRPLSDWLLIISSIGYILFIVALRLQFKDFGAIKAIYFFPGFLGFFLLFARECERFYVWCADKKIVRRSADAIFTALCILYAADAAALLAQLGYSMTFWLGRVV